MIYSVVVEYITATGEKRMETFGPFDAWYTADYWAVRFEENYKCNATVCQNRKADNAEWMGTMDRLPCLTQNLCQTAGK